MAALATDAHMVTVWLRLAKDNGGVPLPRKKGGKGIWPLLPEVKTGTGICWDVPDMVPVAVDQHC